MPLDTNRHLSENDIERYSMAALPEADTACLEEHLLICEACQLRLEEAEPFITAMRGACETVARQELERQRRPWFFPRLIPMFAATALAAALALVFIWTGNTRKLTPAFAIHLEAVRGAGVEAKAPPRRPLVLELDLAGLAASPTYRLEIVDQVGARVWQGTAAAADSKVTASVPPQDRGAYFVRVYLPSGEILREYGLEVNETH
jgi:hypothetical protein